MVDNGVVGVLNIQYVPIYKYQLGIWNWGTPPGMVVILPLRHRSHDVQGGLSTSTFVSFCSGATKMEDKAIKYFSYGPNK